MSIYDVEPREFNLKLAEELKKIPEFKVPEWAIFVKSGANKMRPPAEDNFWFKRAASILRQIHVSSRPLGVSRLRVRYGSVKERGVKPGRFVKSGGKMIRLILQQCESAGLIEKSKTGKAGRIMTEKGRKLLEGIK